MTRVLLLPLMCRPIQQAKIPPNPTTIKIVTPTVRTEEKERPPVEKQEKVQRSAMEGDIKYKVTPHDPLSLREEGVKAKVTFSRRGLKSHRLTIVFRC